MIDTNEKSEKTMQVNNEFIIAACDAAIKWLEWCNSHDVESANMKCCAKSAELFDSLEHLVKACDEELKRQKELD